MALLDVLTATINARPTRLHDESFAERVNARMQRQSLSPLEIAPAEHLLDWAESAIENEEDILMNAEARRMKLPRGMIPVVAGGKVDEPATRGGGQARPGARAPVILQLSPPIPIDTPKGPALAHFLLDYGAEHHVLWGCFIDATRECWWVPNPDVRAQGNPSMGRPAAGPKYVARMGGDAFDSGAEMVTSYVQTPTGAAWPKTTVGWIRHRRDLADIGEPYLSAIRAKQALA